MVDFSKVHASQYGYFVDGVKIQVDEEFLRQYDLYKFWSKVDKKGDDDCWNWTGAKSSGGYGCIGIGGKILTASRVAYRFHYGVDPDTLDVCHTCDNRKCCNPNHLFLGTRYDNMRDMVNKGRNKSFPGESHYYSKIKEEDVYTMRELNKLGLTYASIARLYNMTAVSVSGIVRGRSWKHLNRELNLQHGT